MDQRIADSADLLAYIRQHLLFDIGVTGLSKVDIDDAELASKRTEERRSRTDRLNDTPESGILNVAILSSRCCLRASRRRLKLRLLLGLIKAPLSTESCCSPTGWVLIQCGR
jgi:hypothetical protein